VVPSEDPPPPASSFWLTRFVLLRLLGGVYAVGFLVAVNQVVPLIGAHGLLPVGMFFDRVRAASGSTPAAFLRLPTLFWLAHSDATLVAAAWTGLALSCVVVAGYANALLLAALWLLYLSFVHAGQDWYAFGWESQLLETGFLAIFLVPLLDARPFPRREPPTAVLWLFRWLIFRIMLGSALIKLRGDAVWRNLTALYYHFETQPLPGPLSRWFHFLPHAVLRLGVLFNYLAELVAPWFVFWPRTGRRLAGAVIILFQVTLILSGNLSFLNWLTIVPALACLDDGVWARLLPGGLVRRAMAAAGAAQPSPGMRSVATGVTILVLVLSWNPVVNLLSPGQVMNTSFDPLDLVNTYGAFGTVGKERLNVVFEGTDAEVPDDHAVWKPYAYKGLPVDPFRPPPQVAPYHLRLDWEMWFAAMGTPSQYPWTLHLVWQLLHDDPGALSLFADNPFPKAPPRYIRAVLWRYRFAPPGDPGHRWWRRERLGLWLPPLSVNDPELRRFLAAYDWLPARPAR
jgi:Lipase maturation factor